MEQHLVAEEESDPVLDVIEAFVREHFAIPSDDDYFNANINLWEEGYVDSTGVVELIAFLETEFSVEIPELHLFSPDFTRITGMTKIIRELQAVPGE